MAPIHHTFNRKKYLPMLLLMLGVLVLSGCVGRSPSPNLYILSSIPEQQDTLEKTIRAQQQLQLGIGPLTLADYLNQPKLVTRSGDNQLVRAEFEQWGGSFKKNITTVLTENLSYLMATNQVHLYPWQRSITLDYQIMIDIIRLDGVLGEEVMLVARWSIIDIQKKNHKQTKRSTIVEPVDTNGYAALVSAQSRALGKLSREIANSLQTEMGD
jgi:uncharacterized protein